MQKWILYGIAWPVTCVCTDTTEQSNKACQTLQIPRAVFNFDVTTMSFCNVLTIQKLHIFNSLQQCWSVKILASWQVGRQVTTASVAKTVTAGRNLPPTRNQEMRPIFHVLPKRHTHGWCARYTVLPPILHVEIFISKCHFCCSSSSSLLSSFSFPTFTGKNVCSPKTALPTWFRWPWERSKEKAILASLLVWLCACGYSLECKERNTPRERERKWDGERTFGERESGACFEGKLRAQDRIFPSGNGFPPPRLKRDNRFRRTAFPCRWLRSCGGNPPG